MSEKKQKVVGNFIWRFAERCGAQGVSFVVSIVLARMLAPDVYGTVALITVFTTILQVFVDSGMGNALIQKKEADDVDFSTVFFFNSAVCVVLYAGMCIAAPWIAAFYKRQDLTPLIRVLSLTLVISGVKNVQQAYVSRHLLFKRFFYSTLGGTLFSAVLGIWMAYEGFGAWALVAQQLSNAAIDTLILWITVKWRPTAVFSCERLKGLFSYGWKLLVSSLVDVIYTNLRSLIIGKMYTSSDLAYYNKGRQFPYMIVTNINTSIDSVLLPVMASEQENRRRVKEMTRKAIVTSTYLMAPLMMGLTFVAEPLIRLILTETWLPCVPYMRIFCISFMFYPIHTANLNAIKAMGRSDLFLKLEILKKIVGLALLLATVPYGVMAMTYSLLASSVASQLINAWPNRKILSYGYFEQVRDILPSIMLAVFMGACVSLFGYMNLPDIATLLIQVAVGTVVYVVGSAAFKLSAFSYLWATLKLYIMGRIKR